MAIQVMRLIHEQGDVALAFLDQILPLPFAAFILLGNLHLLIGGQVVVQRRNQRGQLTENGCFLAKSLSLEGQLEPPVSQQIAEPVGPAQGQVVGFEVHTEHNHLLRARGELDLRRVGADKRYASPEAL
jgi:hypothetical protein